MKTELVEKYFRAWSKIILPRARGPIAYVDLFAGPGRYKDDSPSTPLRLLTIAIEDEDLCDNLITIFNDKESDHVQRLKAEIDALPRIGSLRHRPAVANRVVGDDVMDVIHRVASIPTLFFIDPFGYKGLSLGLIEGSIRGWGSECIFFFNYNRINPGLSHPSPAIAAHIDQLFGYERARNLRRTVEGQPSLKRQELIIEATSEALKEAGGRFVLPFAFNSRHGNRPSHYIVFVTKNQRGHDIMKDVMRSLSTDEGAVKSLKYQPVKSPQLALPLDINQPHSITALKQFLMEVCD